MSNSEFPRQFVAQDAALDNWATIEPYFDGLRDRDIDTTDRLERWLVDYSELVAAIQEAGTDRYVKMTCQTDDADRKAAYLDFVENVEPHCKSRCHELDVRYARSSTARELQPDRYQVLDRSIRARRTLFRVENVPLQTEESKLSQQYQEIGGAQTVHFDGKEQTLPQLSRYAEWTDRGVRQEVWEIEAKRRLQDADAIEDIFDRMIELRRQMAENAECGDYCEYAFRALERFDYTPQDCLAFHDAVERAAVPALRALQKERQERLGVDPLRPWDLAVDVQSRPPLRPFETPRELCDKTSRIFHRIDAELGNQFERMRGLGYLDLQSRKSKAPGGYQATYEESRHPFIFMNAVGVQRDVRTLIHEGGHAFHCMASRHDPLLMYRSAPTEFSEVASFGMEMLALDHLDEFYQGKDLIRARRTQLEEIISLFPWVATIDAFQHFLYTHPGHNRDERRRCWLELHDRFGGLADYSGQERALAHSWQRQLHLFEVPFYYIEYGIAKLGALQIWNGARRDRRSAIANYRKALALGGSRPLPELFQAAGAKFDFSYDTLAPLIASVQAALSELPC